MPSLVYLRVLRGWSKWTPRRTRRKSLWQKSSAAPLASL